VEHPWPFGNKTTLNQIMALKTMAVEQALNYENLKRSKFAQFCAFDIVDRNKSL
jgi:hypothetical protein